MRLVRHRRRLRRPLPLGRPLRLPCEALAATPPHALALACARTTHPQAPAAAARLPCGLRGAVRAAAAAAGAGADYRSRAPKDVRVLVVGATGYIGKFVVKELVARGYDVVAFARERSGIGGKQGAEDVRRELPGADVRFGDVMSIESLKREGFQGKKVDVVVSCLASRTGARAAAAVPAGPPAAVACSAQVAARSLLAARAAGEWPRCQAAAANCRARHLPAPSLLTHRPRRPSCPPPCRRQVASRTAGTWTTRPRSTRSRRGARRAPATLCCSPPSACRSRCWSSSAPSWRSRRSCRRVLERGFWVHRAPLVRAARVLMQGRGGAPLCCRSTLAGHWTCGLP